jgi:hypothetical protein
MIRDKEPVALFAPRRISYHSGSINRVKTCLCIAYARPSAPNPEVSVNLKGQMLSCPKSIIEPHWHKMQDGGQQLPTGNAAKSSFILCRQIGAQ